MVISAKKRYFVLKNFLNLQFFFAKNIPTATKLRPDIRSILNLSQKNLCDHLITIDEKIWKKEPPPWELSTGGGGGWNHQFMTFFTWHEKHFAGTLN